MSAVVDVNTTGKAELATAVKSNPSAASVVGVAGTVSFGRVTVMVWFDLVTVKVTFALNPALNEVLAALDA